MNLILQYFVTQDFMIFVHDFMWHFSNAWNYIPMWNLNLSSGQISVGTINGYICYLKMDNGLKYIEFFLGENKKRWKQC